MRIHSKNCSSYKHKYFGDRRNVNPNEMQDCDCDGYHTFDELYDHRIILYIKLCEYRVQMADGRDHEVWRSKYHSDDELTFGGTWFVLGIWKEKGKQITYHLPIERWEETNFAETLDKAPKWDGHTPEDVLERLKAL